MVKSTPGFPLNGRYRSQREKRMSSEFEEGVVATHTVQGKQLLPDARDELFSSSERCNVFGIAQSF